MIPALILLAGLQSHGPSDIDFVKAWDATQKAIERNYYARDTRRAEMMDHLREFGPKASRATSKGEFRDIVDAMIEEFKDSHFDMLTDEDQGYYLMDGLARGNDAAQMPDFGAWFKKAKQGYTVQMVLESTEAEKAGLRKGDLMLTVDGQPFSPVVGLKPDVDKDADLRFSRGGKEMEAKVAVRSEPALEMFLKATRDSARIINVGGKRIGYVHLWTQASDKFRSALEGIVNGKLSSTDGMILDLRDGFGGRPEGYGDPFFRPGVTLEWKTGKGGYKQEFGYGKPLVVLINGGSRSAKEVLSFVFKASHRATLIGSNTAGNVLGTTPSKLNDWAYLEIPVVEVYANGVRLEGKGVAPDIALPSETDAQGNDLYIDTAVKFLTKRV